VFRTPRARSAPHLRARGIGSVIPEPDDQKAHRRRRGSSGGRPVSDDKNAYRGRDVIERAFNGFKHWRDFATRYDKHAVVYRGGLVLAAALIWLVD
jgi:transposase